MIGSKAIIFIPIKPSKTSDDDGEFVE